MTRESLPDLSSETPVPVELDHLVDELVANGFAKPGESRLGCRMALAEALVACHEKHGLRIVVSREET